MKKKLSFVLVLLCCLLLLPLTAKPAYAGDYDRIVSYDVEVVPNTADGSLQITMRFDWTALEALQYGTELKIGVPNGSIRDMQKLTGNIETLQYDNSYMYVYMDRSYQSGETFSFAFSWVQEYMYTLGDNGSVSYDYTPGWFDEARIDRMTVRWVSPADVAGTFKWNAGEQSKWTQDGTTLSAADLSYGSRVNLTAEYPNWPTQLSWEGSSENLPGGEWQEWVDPAPYDDDDGSAAFVLLVIFLIVVFIILKAVFSDDGYQGGFGTVHHTYIYTGGLWYPAGPDHKPIPGSTGLPKKPAAPKSGSNHKGGGFGGGSRGGGFGGGFGGGSRCACASSCACACACACAGGGRAGCSAKNLYGAVKLDRELTEAMGAEQNEEL